MLQERLGVVVHDVIARLRGDTVSCRWLRYQRHRDERIEFHGVAWRWPATCRCGTRAHPYLDMDCPRHGALAHANQSNDHDREVA